MTHSPATHALSVNPATGETLAAYPWATSDEVQHAIALADSGFRQWRNESVAHRAQKLRDLGATLRNRAEEMAKMMSREMGKPILQARAEVAKSASLCDWYAEHGPAMLRTEATQVENNNAVIEYRPLGPILAVMPWNFPLWQVLRGAVPVLLAGNSYLLKHAPNVLGSAQLIAQIFTEADFPEGVFGWVNATNEGVSQAINDRRIAAITVTGSVRAGAAIGAQAGAALKKCVLELGGSDPFIVLNDADLDLALKAAVAGRYQNTGQVCAAAKRFIVEEGIADRFTERFVQATAALKMGAPDQEENYLGPMARYDLRDELHQQVQATLAEGATLLLGGEKVAGKGNYYAPTVLGNVTPEMTAFRQELFGPVAAITVAKRCGTCPRTCQRQRLWPIRDGVYRKPRAGREIRSRAGVRRGVHQWL
ncbi:aldehyde dehydrogenase [Enterobacter cancerogenus]|uniref:Aldehyde dehydrogenase n=1 Tax=Enterobacter cancerogenus TaxID=69218 RepID=A0A484XJR6_9ENTR|nr:aldehyde dehydrogenase [Enterobacter cancerogenus]